MNDVIKICRVQDKREASQVGGTDRCGRSDNCARLTAELPRAMLPASGAAFPSQGRRSLDRRN